MASRDAAFARQADRVVEVRHEALTRLTQRIASNLHQCDEYVKPHELLQGAERPYLEVAGTPCRLPFVLRSQPRAICRSGAVPCSGACRPSSLPPVGFKPKGA